MISEGSDILQHSLFAPLQGHNSRAWIEKQEPAVRITSQKLLRETRHTETHGENGGVHP